MRDETTGRDWAAMTPRDFDAQAADVQLSLFPAPDALGSFGALFDDEAARDGR